jgi:hypothetical protein
MPHVASGKQRTLEILYGDSADTVTKFKIGSGNDPIVESTTDLETPISYGGGELQDIDSHTYVSGTKTMESTCTVGTTDYTGNISEFGIYTASGTMMFGETFPTYYKDGSTNVKFVAKDTHL